MNKYSELAKMAVENYIESGKIISVPDEWKKEFSEKKAGVFVTIEKKPARNASPHSDAGGGRLRGCIGTYLPVRENIGEEIIHNAIAAAAEDSRFGQIKKTELPHLSYIVYILEKPEPIKDIAELDPKKFGVIVKAEQKSGLLLPDLDGVNTAQEQIAICCQKGGIYLKNDKDIIIYRFTAEKHR